MENLEEKQTEVEILKFNLYDLPSYRDAKAAQEALAKTNPYIEVVDKESYKEGKKRRTALLKGRTLLQEGETVINRRLTDIKRFVSDETGKLIAITQPHEEKQQTEVKRYEGEQEAKKNEEIRLENERKQKIKDQIEEFRKTSVETIYNATYQNINQVISDIKDFSFDFAEFGEELKFVENELSLNYDRKKKFLDSEEELRKSRIKMELSKQRIKLLLQYGTFSNDDLSEMSKDAFDKLLSETKEKYFKEQEAKEIERRKNEEREAEFKKLVAEKQQREVEEKTGIESEKQRLPEAEQRKEEKEKICLDTEKKQVDEEKPKAEAETEHIERPKTDKEKITYAVQSTSFPIIELSDCDMIDYYRSISIALEEWKKQIIDSLI